MRKKAILLALMLFLACFALIAAAEESGGDGETTYRALLIGVDSYSTDALSGCITDANRVSGMLQATNEAGASYSPENITVRTNLTSTEIQTVLNDLASAGADADDVTFFYFAGHGFLNNGTDAGIVGNDGKSVALSIVKKFLDEVDGSKIVAIDARYLDRLLNESSPETTLTEYNNLVCSTFADDNYYVVASATRASDAQAAFATMAEPCGMTTVYLTEACGYDYMEQRPIALAADANGNGATTLPEAQAYVAEKLALLSGEGTSYLYDVRVHPNDSMFPLAAKRGSIEINAISFAADEMMLATGRSVQLTVNTDPVNASTRGITWTSSDLSVATVSSGYVEGIKPGETYIMASSSNGLSASVRVNVVDVTFVENIALDAAKYIIAPGTGVKLNAALEPENATEEITWTSTDESVAMVDGDGNITAMGIGECSVVCASGGGISAACSVRVADGEKVVKEIKLSTDSITLYAGEAEILKYKTNPSAVLDDSVRTVSSDESVVSGSDTNRIIAQSAGTATVRAISTSGAYAECKVTVKTPKLSMGKKTLNLKENGTATLNVSITPALLANSITWASSDETVATVDSKGKVTAVALGICNVTASAPGGNTATCEVTVSGVDVTAIKLDTTSKAVTVNETFTITAALKPENASLKAIRWTSSDEAVATVSEGVVTARSAGKALIVASSHNKKSASCKLVVKPIAVTEVTLSDTAVTLVKGVEGLKSMQISATTQPAEAGNGSLKWQSSDPKVAKVDGTGKITAVGAGKCKIRAQSRSNKSVYAIVNVKVENNRVAYKEPVYDENVFGLYTSAKKIGYVGNKLYIQLFFYNHSAKPCKAPEAGILTLTLADGTSYEIMEIPAGKVKMAAKKLGAKLIKIDVSNRKELQGLDLRGATATIVTGAVSLEQAETPDAQAADDAAEEFADLFEDDAEFEEDDGL
ncbi:MAG: Ig-like domain-containing protein [Christensenellales bacterium]|jgi:uncharacterized protein YjdB